MPIIRFTPALYTSLTHRMTLLNKSYRLIKAIFPNSIARPIRSVGTALLTPLSFSLRTGHFRSSLRNMAVDRNGSPLPWYTYPCIDFLRNRSFDERRILEFGAGQSTLWWAARARQVVSFEGNTTWYQTLAAKVPSNTDLFLFSMASRVQCVREIDELLQSRYGNLRFDIVVIDGLCRENLPEIAEKWVSADGAIICDNAERYGFYHAFKAKPFRRVDFFGYAPGVVQPHTTAIYFNPTCFLFSPTHRMTL